MKDDDGAKKKYFHNLPPIDPQPYIMKTESSPKSKAADSPKKQNKHHPRKATNTSMNDKNNPLLKLEAEMKQIAKDGFRYPGDNIISQRKLLPTTNNILANSPEL